MINYRSIRASGTSHVLLLVQVLGDKLVVKSGQFNLERQDWNLADDHEFTFTTRTETAYVTGFLVVHKDTGEVGFLVDEEVVGTGDVSYSFNGSPYKCLHRYIHTFVPGDTTDFSALAIDVWRIEPPAS